jgi:dTDP-4-dehydrorhamnose 3,5-epimerase
VTVIRGCIYDVVVDLRQTSSTFGEWFGIELSDEGTRQLYMPPGFAHGFCVISDWVDLHYKVSQFYDPLDEGGLYWDDPDIGIVWPIAKPRVSKRDASFPKLKSINHDKLPSII